MPITKKLKLRQAYFMSMGKMLLTGVIYRNCFAATIIMVCVQSYCHVVFYSYRLSSLESSSVTDRVLKREVSKLQGKIKV